MDKRYSVVLIHLSWSQELAEQVTVDSDFFSTCKFSREETWQSKPVWFFELIPRDAIKWWNWIQNFKKYNKLMFPLLFCWHALFTGSWLRVLLWLIGVLASFSRVCHRTGFCSKEKAKGYLYILYCILVIKQWSWSIHNVQVCC